MPFINIKTNTSITSDKETSIKKKLGTAVSIIRKSENWLMINFEDMCRMWFRGNSDIPCAFAEVKLYGKASPDEYEELTEKITEMISSELDIQPSQIYVKYEEVKYWGYNGCNF